MEETTQNPDQIKHMKDKLLEDFDNRTCWNVDTGKQARAVIALTFRRLVEVENKLKEDEA